MSYDLAVWEGARPTTKAEADAAYLRIVERLEAPTGAPPTPAIRSYVESLIALWPELTDDPSDEGPWADTPLLNNADGDMIYFGMVRSRSEESSAVAARIAHDLGLVCYDPQWESLRPPLSEQDRSADEGSGQGARRPRWWRRGARTP